jgi:hypothetical protein
MTVIGGREITDAVAESAALLGFEASRTEPPSGTVEFVDYPFTADETDDERVRMLLKQVRRHQPQIAVGPDIEGEVSLSDAVDVGDRLLDAGAETVVLVPKDVEPADVPPRFRVGYPAASFGSGADWPIYDYVGLSNGVHILGGSPTDQLEIAEYGVPVESVDGSAVEKGAKHYDVWTPETPHWEHAGDYSDLYQRVRVSLDNMALAWAERSGLEHPIVQGYVTGADLRAEQDAVEEEVRRRQAGRGPPIADPDTGEYQDVPDGGEYDGEAITDAVVRADETETVLPDDEDDETDDEDREKVRADGQGSLRDY